MTSEVYAATRSQDLLNELSPSELRQVRNTLIWRSKLFKYYLKSYKLESEMNNFDGDNFMQELQMMLNDPLMSNMRILKKRGMRLL